MYRWQANLIEYVLIAVVGIIVLILSVYRSNVALKKELEERKKKDMLLQQRNDFDDDNWRGI